MDEPQEEDFFSDIPDAQPAEDGNPYDRLLDEIERVRARSNAPTDPRDPLGLYAEELPDLSDLARSETLDEQAVRLLEAAISHAEGDPEAFDGASVVRGDWPQSLVLCGALADETVTGGGAFDFKVQLTEIARNILKACEQKFDRMRLPGNGGAVESFVDRLGVDEAADARKKYVEGMVEYALRHYLFGFSDIGHASLQNLYHQSLFAGDLFLFLLTVARLGGSVRSSYVAEAIEAHVQVTAKATRARLLAIVKDLPPALFSDDAPRAGRPKAPFSEWPAQTVREVTFASMQMLKTTQLAQRYVIAQINESWKLKPKLTRSTFRRKLKDEGIDYYKLQQQCIEYKRGGAVQNSD